MPRSGIEPPTLRSSGACSTTELPRQVKEKSVSITVLIFLILSMKDYQNLMQKYSSAEQKTVIMIFLLH